MRNDPSESHNPLRRRLLGGLAALPLAGATGPALAQAGRQYRIELVIFEHRTDESRRLQMELAAPREAMLGESELGGRIYRDSRKGFELQRVVRRVEDSGAGRILASLAWDQTGRDHASAPWLRVQQGRRIGTRDLLRDEADRMPRPLMEEQDERFELEGRLRIWVGRFLHLETDLIYHVEEPQGDQPPRAITVRGSQRMNSGDELFYLDHPVIGMIARVTRIDRS
ncbi:MULTISPECIES: CsiV family protein [unclassified Thioalkalivibrio]|uniref:CsiV family protein n=1 Tax=unclassified Thioalkalivibrio TaxID=2621013 RepID=UPI0003800D91|nr:MULTISPECIES: CsiV family protein [unclassified Thioalkalivibrio]